MKVAADLIANVAELLGKPQTSAEICTPPETLYREARLQMRTEEDVGDQA